VRVATNQYKMWIRLLRRSIFGNLLGVLGVKRGERDVDPGQARQLRDQKAAMQGQLAELSKQDCPRLPGKCMDLADMVGGGDGRGSGVKGAGIVQETGEVTVQKLGSAPERESQFFTRASV